MDELVYRVLRASIRCQDCLDGCADSRCTLRDLLVGRFGRAQQSLEQFSAFRSSCEFSQHGRTGLYNLAQALAKAGKPEAKEYTVRFNALEQERQLTDRVQQLGNFGLEAANARNWPQAVEDLNEALRICGVCRFSADLHRNLGLIYCRKGDVENGKRELETALKLRPDDSDARKALDVLASIPVKPVTAR